MNKKLYFNDNKFVILQVSDPQDFQYPRRVMLKMLERAYDKIKPDLVVLTGDNILGNHLLDARFGSKQDAFGWEATRERIEKSLSFILQPLEKRGIPFAMIFGNHDDMNDLTKEEQLEVYRGYSCFVDGQGSKLTGTYNIPIYSGDKPIFNIWMMDTAWQDKAEKKCHTGVTAAAVEWYREKSNELKALNGGKPLPSLMFEHIPFPETEGLIEKCSKADKGAVKTRDGGYIRLNPARAKGFLNEPTPGYKENNGQFAAMCEQGDVLAAVFGHHHLNCFEGRLNDINIIQTPAASFRCYGNRLRGVRTFELNAAEPNNYKTEHISYFDLMGRNPASLLGYFLQADGLGKARAAAGIGIAAAATAAVIIAKKK